MNMASHRSNSFDLIRHAAALAVLISHHHDLSRIASPKFFGLMSYGALAVLVFFAISGFLVTKSFSSSGSFWVYFEKRIRRLFPALIACAVLMVIVLGGAMGDLPFMSYVFSSRAYHAFNAIVWMEGTGDLNGFAQDFKFKNAANGSLWTLRYEFFSYIIIPCAILLICKGSKPILSVSAVLAVCIGVQIAFSISGNQIASIHRQTLLLIPFAVGALMYFTESVWNALKPRIAIFALCASVIALGSNLSVFMPFIYASIAASIVVIGMASRDKIISGRFDVSYGIYIYAFPVQQILINKTQLGFYSSMAASAAITMVLSVLSWHLIEKPFLKRSSSIRVSALQEGTATRV